MTYKELKKLNRLEILELLLEQSKLNEKLKQEIQEIKKTSNIEKTIENLEILTSQINSVLNNSDSHLGNIQNDKTEEQPSESKSGEINNIRNISAGQEKDSIFNKNLYSRIMYFFWQNESVLLSLPEDLRNDIRIKLRSILDGRK